MKLTAIIISIVALVLSVILGILLYQNNKENKVLTIKLENAIFERDSINKLYIDFLANDRDSIIYKSVPGRKIRIIDSIPYPVYAGDTNTYKRVYEESSVTDDYSAEFKITTIGKLDAFDWKIIDYNDTVRVPYIVYKDVEKQVYKNMLFLTLSTRVPTVANRDLNFIGIGATAILKNGFGIGIENKFLFNDRPIQEIKLLWNPFQKTN